MTHLKQNLRGEVSTDRSEGFRDTRRNWLGKVPFVENSRDSLLFLIAWCGPQFCQHDPGDGQIPKTSIVQWTIEAFKNILSH